MAHIWGCFLFQSIKAAGSKDTSFFDSGKKEAKEGTFVSGLWKNEKKKKDSNEKTEISKEVS